MAAGHNVWAGEHIYRMNPAPEFMPPDECISLFKSTGEEKYLAHFLHFAEPKLNRLTKTFAERYSLRHILDDIKGTIVAAIAERINTYDPGRGVPFLKYVQPYVNDALHNFAAENGGVFAVSPGHYKTLRAIAYEYFEGSEKSQQEKISKIANQHGISEKTVRGYIEEAERFRYYDFVCPFDDDEEDEQGVDPSDTHSLRPDIIVPNAPYMDEVSDCIESVLTYKQQEILFALLGIACIYCGRTTKRKTYAEIANDFELSSESAAEKTRRKAIEVVRAEMRRRGLM